MAETAFSTVNLRELTDLIWWYSPFISRKQHLNLKCYFTKIPRCYALKNALTIQVKTNKLPHHF